ncbi:c-type cytochrome [Antarctobacter jejuensis]|uniref:c-type cytochrome n=1 Tax=Antarctobacter jejuensis TaxID=1439938 RepID=UPI003FD5CE0B
MKRFLLAITAVLAVSACDTLTTKLDGTSRSWFTPLTDPVAEDAMHPGAAIYNRNCAYCHGDTGQGDGALGRELPVAPVDLTLLAAANGGTFPAERVLETVHGYPGKFHRGSMPEFGQELSGPLVEWRAPSGEIIMTPKGLMDVVSYVESLQADRDG